MLGRRGLCGGAQVRRQNSECGWQGGWREFEVGGRGVGKARWKQALQTGGGLREDPLPQGIVLLPVIMTSVSKLAPELP